MSSLSSSSPSSSCSLDATIRDFCARQKDLLDLELLEEQQQQQQDDDDGGGGSGGGHQRGTKQPRSSSSKNNNAGAPEEERQSDVLSGLQVSQIGVGLYGRTVVTFTPLHNCNNSNKAAASGAGAGAGADNGGAPSPAALLQLPPVLPPHRLTSGDEVEIRTKTGSSRAGGGGNGGGVVCQVTETSVSVALFGGKGGGDCHRRNNGNKNSKSGKKKNDDDDDDDDAIGFDAPPPYALVPRSSVQVHAKMVAALDELGKYGPDHEVSGRVVRALFDPSSSVVHASSRTKAKKDSNDGTDNNNNNNNSGGDRSPFNPNLDESQVEAIAFCLESAGASATTTTTPSIPVSLVHGPPGTGKTTTVASLVLEAVYRHDYKVLVTAPSNVAVDTLLAKLVETQRQYRQQRDGAGGGKNGSSKKKRNQDSGSGVGRRKLSVVRLGHPARLREDILPYSLEHQVQNAEETELVADARRELASYLQLLRGGRRTRYEDRQLARQEIRHLRKEIRTREERIVRSLLGEAQVVLATCVGAANGVLKKHCEFDLVVIDEAAQALEAACWIPVLQAKRKLVLAGDHRQLPPTIKSTRPVVQVGLKQTMFERLMELYQPPERIARMLQVQYRMNEKIANWASEAMYNGKLQSHPSVRHRTLTQLVSRRESIDEHNVDVDNDADDDVDPPVLLFIDTAGCGMYESVNDSLSRYNTGEARLVVHHVRHLLSIGAKPHEVAVISPYSGQVQVLKTAFQKEDLSVEVRTVDGFQGGERETVILSLVRSSASGSGHRSGGSIGFLRDDRRLNVAVTRAKRHCCVIGDSETLNTSPFVKNLLEWMNEHGEHKSAMEYGHDEFMALDTVVDASAAAMQSRLMLETQRQMEEFVKAESNTSTSAVKAPGDEEEYEERTKELIARIHVFVETAAEGEELVFSPDLSKRDRFIVHVEAEKLGIGHRSEGVDGMDRHIILSKVVPSDGTAVISDATPARATGQEEMTAEVEDDETDAEENELEVLASFDVLQIDEESDGGDSVEEEYKQADQEVGPVASANTILGDLANERAERLRQQKKNSKEAVSNGPATSSKKKKKKKKKKGQKLGGAKKKPPAELKEEKDAAPDDLDDMAFLDAQIEKVQNSHGRKFEGKGGYRTVMNGILLAKPEPPEAKKDARATQALQSKLKQAQNDRKAKSKKK